MNKILIVCDGKSVTFETKQNAKKIVEFIISNRDVCFVCVGSGTFVDPSKVTVVKDITLEIELHEKTYTKRK